MKPEMLLDIQGDISAIKNIMNELEKLSDKEKKLITETPITMDCFEMDDFKDFNLESQDIIFPLKSTWESLISDLEFCRQKYNKTKDERYLKELIRLLPNSYKVVKL